MVLMMFVVSMVPTVPIVSKVPMLPIIFVQFFLNLLTYFADIHVNRAALEIRTTMGVLLNNSPLGMVSTKRIHVPVCIVIPAYQYQIRVKARYWL